MEKRVSARAVPTLSAPNKTTKPATRSIMRVMATSCRDQTASAVPVSLCEFRPVFVNLRLGCPLRRTHQYLDGWCSAGLHACPKDKAECQGAAGLNACTTPDTDSRTASGNPMPSFTYAVTATFVPRRTRTGSLKM